MVAYTPSVEGPIGAMFMPLLVGTLYFPFALIVAYCLLKSEPSFLVAAVLVIATTALVGALTVSNTGTMIDFCTSGESACEWWFILSYRMIGVFASLLVMTGMIFIGWSRCGRQKSFSAPAP